jgi:hypothetical protein
MICFKTKFQNNKILSSPSSLFLILQIMSGDDEEEAMRPIMRVLHEYEPVGSFEDQVWQSLESARRVIRGEITQDEGDCPPIYNSVPTCPQEEAGIKIDVLYDPSVVVASNIHDSQHMFVVYKGDPTLCTIVDNTKSQWSWSPNTMSEYT